MSNDPKKPAVEKTLDEKISDAVTKGLAEAIPAAAGVFARIQAETQFTLAQGVQAARAASVPTGLTCAKCRQKLPAGMTDETHPHRFLAVYPQNARKHGHWFQGVKINGVTYLSNSLQHKIYVPEDANIEHLIEQWEDNEDELQTGRVVDHDSGSTRRPIQATAGWR